MKKLIILLFFGVFIAKTQAQEYFPNNESIPNKNNYYTAFTNAKIYVTPTQIIEKGTYSDLDNSSNERIKQFLNLLN